MSEKAGRNSRCPCGSGKKFKHCCFVKTQVRPSPISVVMDKPVQEGTAANPTLPPPELYRIAKAVGFKDGETWALRTVAERVEELVKAVWHAKGHLVYLIGMINSEEDYEADGLIAKIREAGCVLEKAANPMRRAVDRCPR